VKARHWLIFAGWQLAGYLTGLGAHHVDAISWAISGFMLMPGTLLSICLFRQGGIGNTWQKWTIFAVAVTANSVLFAILSILRARRSKINQTESPPEIRVP
jgi:hypothetical protein